jgi:hypothetical protein
MRQEQPPITIDPGPFRAVVLCWAGRCVTQLTGGGSPAKTASTDPPIIVKPSPVGPPVVARLQMSVADALGEEPPEVGEGPDIPAEHMPWDADLSEQRFPAVPTDNAITIQVTIRGNIVDLDQHEDALAASLQTGQPLLFRLVDA